MNMFIARLRAKNILALFQNNSFANTSAIRPVKQDNLFRNSSPALQSNSKYQHRQ